MSVKRMVTVPRSSEWRARPGASARADGRICSMVERRVLLALRGLGVRPGGMLMLYGVVLALPALRHFYELQILSVPEYAIIVHVVLGWAIALRFVWRLDVPGRVGKFWRWLIA